jgi:hypothetical protein
MSAGDTVPNEVKVYLRCMEEVRDRVNVVQAIVNRHITTGRDVFDIELVL